MQDYLIGYLLDALEPAEHELVEARLENDPQLRRDLEVLSRSLNLLAADRAAHEPPVGLANRTCQFVAVQTKAMPAPPVQSVPSRWSVADLAMAAGIFLAATMLFWPAMNQSRFAARLAGCKNNLGKLGMALESYSTRFPGQFPTPAASGNLAHAGVYAVLLKQQGYIEPQVLICPASELADRAGDLKVPSCDEVLAAQAEQLVELRSRLRGIYGYNLGFVVQGRYHPPKHLRRATQALMADAPCTTAPLRRSNIHGDCGQNVLFGDMHVQFLTTCKARGCSDHIFVNDQGLPRAGLHEGDSVIGAADDAPLAEGVRLEAAPWSR